MSRVIELLNSKEFRLQYVDADDAPDDICIDGHFSLDQLKRLVEAIEGDLGVGS